MTSLSSIAKQDFHFESAVSIEQNRTFIVTRIVTCFYRSITKCYAHQREPTQLRNAIYTLTYIRRKFIIAYTLFVWVTDAEVIKLWNWSERCITYYILSVGTGNDFNIGFGVGAHSRYLAYTLHRICATYPPKYSDVFGTLLRYDFRCHLVATKSHYH